MNARELRSKFLEFFDGKGHHRLPSDSLVPDDPSLLFTSAGMVQFKPYISGAAKAPFPRITSCQKCLRTTDIEEVGNASHLTFFEMLGNFSIFDYFKEDALKWSWEFLTSPQWLALDPAKLCVTVYKDDDEAFAIWRKLGLPESKIVRLDEDKNFWPAGAPSEGPNGPCGPCSEIFFQTVPDSELAGDYLVDADAGRWLEIWNNVFMQFERRSDPDDLTKDVELVPLPKPCIDTGMGLERTTTVLGGFSDVYQIDTMKPIMDRVSELSGNDLSDPSALAAARIITDHLRAASFCIADGVFPANTGRGYVLRRLIRRAVLKGQLYLQFRANFLSKVALVARETLGDHYSELSDQFDQIKTVLDSEESLFRRTVTDGAIHFHLKTGHLMNQLWASNVPGSEPGGIGYDGISPKIGLAIRMPDGTAKVVTLEFGPTMLSAIGIFEPWILPGAIAFELYDTFGFPLELTEELAERLGGNVDKRGFEHALKDQRERSRSHQEITGQVFTNRVMLFTASDAKPYTDFVGYDCTSIQSKLVQISPVFLADDQPAKQFDVALAETPFYAESGGEVGDTGRIFCDAFELRVVDTQKAEGIWWHRCEVVRSHKPIVGGLRSIGAEGDKENGSDGTEPSRTEPSRTEPFREEQIELLKSGYLFQDVTAEVDAERRRNIVRNHTATHLLHAALRKTLGDHVRQAGSLVAPDYLRFDFTHGAAMIPEELNAVERLVNEWIFREIDVTIYNDVPIAEAKAKGAMALFGEKYGDTVRMVEVPGFSIELCGGCHVKNTGNIDLFKITHESSAAGGVRRIEAVTGKGVYDYLLQRDSLVKDIATGLKSNPNDLKTAVEKLHQEARDLRQQLEKAISGGAGQSGATITNVKGVPLVTQKLEGLPASAAGTVADNLANQNKGAVVLVGAESDGKVLFVAKVSPEAQAMGAHAGNLVREVAKIAGGSGGGRPDFAQAGGKDPSKLADALAHAPAVLDAQLSS